MFSQYVTNILDWLLLLDHLINCIGCFEGLKVAKVHVLHQKHKFFYGGKALFKLCTIRIPIVNTMQCWDLWSPQFPNKILFTYCLLLTFTNQCTCDSEWDVEQRFHFAKRKPIKCGQLARNDGMGQGAGQLQARHQPAAAVLTSARYPSHIASGGRMEPLISSSISSPHPILEFLQLVHIACTDCWGLWVYPCYYS